jgi:hypothetical protein
MNNLIKRFLGSRAASAADLSGLMAESERVIAQVRGNSLTYCGKPKLENLRDAAMRVRREGVKGSFIEAGVALGGSAILLAKMKPPGTTLNLYDVFSMIPPPGPADGEDAHKRYAEIKSGGSSGLGGNVYYGYVDDLIEQVKKNLDSFGVETVRDKVNLIQGLFEDTLYPQGPVALAHIDCDWYEPVRTCIDRILPKLSPGGILVFDDYSSYSGCTKAVNELLEERPDIEKIFHNRSLGVRLKAE